MNAVVLDGYTLNPGDLSWEGVSSQVEEFTLYDGTPQELAAQRIGDCEIVFTNKVEITREVMEACPSMKTVSYTHLPPSSGMSPLFSSPSPLKSPPLCAKHPEIGVHFRQPYNVGRGS